MADIGARSFTIDASSDLPADGYTAELASSATFLSALETDKITLEAGFIDPAAPAIPETVRHIEGNIDTYEIEIQKDRITSRIQGRDKIFNLLDRQFKKLFTSEEPEEDPGVEFSVGNFLASEIAEEIAAFAGLDLAWQCRDYVMIEDFDASGRPIDILRRLVEPWSLAPRTQVDIFIQGSTVFCRQRPGNFVADYTFTSKDARITRMTIRKKVGRYFGKVTLFGRLVPKDIEEEPGVGGGIIISSGEVERVRVNETFDAKEQIETRVITKETLRMPDKIVIESTTTTYGNVKTRVQTGGTEANPVFTTFTEFEITKLEQRFNEYDDSTYNSRGATNQPKQKAQRIETQEKRDGTMTLTRKETMFYAHDTLGFQSMTTHNIFSLQEDGDFLESKRIVKTQADVENLKVEQVTSTWEVEDDELVLRSVDTQVSAGLRAAGSRPPSAIGAAGTDTDQVDVPTEQISLEKVISTHEKAIDLRFSNRNMKAEDLQFIMDQLEAANGLWEYEIVIEYVAMPWLRKQSVLHITSLFAEDGVTPITLVPALVTDQRLSFNEATIRAQMTSSITAKFWRSF